MSDGVREVKRDGEYYQVKGRVNGREVSAHVPAHNVDSMSTKEGKAFLERSIKRVAESEG